MLRKLECGLSRGRFGNGFCKVSGDLFETCRAIGGYWTEVGILMIVGAATGRSRLRGHLGESKIIDAWPHQTIGNNSAPLKAWQKHIPDRQKAISECKTGGNQKTQLATAGYKTGRIWKYQFAT